MTGYAQTDYCSLAELKAQLRIGDTVDDTAVATAITAASRAIDLQAARQFGLDPAPATRYYTYDGACIEGRPAVEIDDLMTSGGLVVSLDTGTEGTYTGSVVLGTDYDLWPRNAAADLRPWTHIVLRRAPAFFFPYWPGAVRVEASFGWSSVPMIVEQACLIQAARFFVRRDSTYGVAGDPSQGSQVRLFSKLDPDVALMVSTVRRWWGVAK